MRVLVLIVRVVRQSMVPQQCAGMSKPTIINAGTSVFDNFIRWNGEECEVRNLRDRASCLSAGGLWSYQTIWKHGFKEDSNTCSQGLCFPNQDLSKVTTRLGHSLSLFLLGSVFLNMHIGRVRSYWMVLSTLPSRS